VVSYVQGINPGAETGSATADGAPGGGFVNSPGALRATSLTSDLPSGLSFEGGPIQHFSSFGCAFRSRRVAAWLASHFEMCTRSSELGFM
jgi:hypothetical protein